MKKLLCVFLCIAFLFISAACNSNKTIASSSETTTSQPHTEPYHPDSVGLRFDTLDEFIHAHQNGYPEFVEMISQIEDEDFRNSSRECIKTVTSHALYKPTFTGLYPVPEVVFEKAEIAFFAVPIIMNPERSFESECWITTVWSEPYHGTSLSFTHIFYMNNEETLKKFKDRNKDLAKSNYKEYYDLESGQKVLASPADYYLEESSLYFRIEGIDLLTFKPQREPWAGGPFSNLMYGGDEEQRIYFGLEKIADPPSTTQK